MTIAQRHATLLAFVASGAAGAAWLGLAVATGLIFHFMPAAPSIAGAWVLSRRRGGPGSRSIATAILLFGVLTAFGVAMLLAIQDRPLDEPWATAIVIVAGVLIGARLLGRQHPVGA